MNSHCITVPSNAMLFLPPLSLPSEPISQLTGHLVANWEYGICIHPPSIFRVIYLFRATEFSLARALINASESLPRPNFWGFPRPQR